MIGEKYVPKTPYLIIKVVGILYQNIEREQTLWRLLRGLPCIAWLCLAICVKRLHVADNKCVKQLIMRYY